MTRYRFLGVLHFVVGFLLLPLSLLFGFLALPLVMLGPLWILVLGFLLFRGGGDIRNWIRRTHIVALGFAILLCGHGVLSLQAAARSAEGGGGLLGGYGLIPIAFGLLLGLTSIVSLVLTRSPGGDQRRD
jgi:hypothetical protein